MEIGYGKISKFEDETDANGDYTKCRVIPSEDNGAVTLPLIIPWYWRKRFGNLQVEDEVCFCRKSNGSGLIISRLDGEWDGVVRNEQTLIQVNGNAAIRGNSLIEGNADIIGELNADGDISLSKGLEITGSNTNIGGTVKIDGKTSSGAMPFNGFPGGVDPIDGVKTDIDTVMASPLSGGKAEGNKGSYGVKEE